MQLTISIMKTNLDEFIKHENDDIVEQHAFIKNVEKIYSELTKLFDEFHFEDLKPSDDKITENIASQSSQVDSCQISTKPQINQTSPIGSTSTSKLISDTNIRINNLRIANENEIGILQDKVCKQNYSKDAYRKELLQQIEEKQKLKQLENERLLRQQEELEKKMSEQRLAMYLEYLQEQKCGQFLVKSKNVANDMRTNVTELGNSNLLQISHKNPNSNKMTVSTEVENDCKQSKTSIIEDFISDNDQDSLEISASKQKNVNDKNILTNLNEVRKIMQSDHIEMLENLLNCNK